MKPTSPGWAALAGTVAAPWALVSVRSSSPALAVLEMFMPAAFSIEQTALAQPDCPKFSTPRRYGRITDAVVDARGGRDAVPLGLLCRNAGVDRSSIVSGPLRRGVADLPAFHGARLVRSYLEGNAVPREHQPR